MKKLVMMKVQVGRKEMYNILVKDKSVASKDKEICHD